MSGWAAIIIANPSRTISWSSTTATRTSGLTAAPPGELTSRMVPPPGRSLRSQVPLRAATRSSIPSRPEPRSDVRRRPDPVVTHAQPHPVSGPPQLDPDVRGVRVAGHVGQGLLGDPVDREQLDRVQHRARPRSGRPPSTPWTRRGAASSSSMSSSRGGAETTRGESGSRRCTTSASSSPSALRPRSPMLRSAASGSAICPASACTTIAVTWWPTTSCSSRARLVRCSSQAARPRSAWASPESWSVCSRARSSRPRLPPRMTPKNAADRRAPLVTNRGRAPRPRGRLPSRPRGRRAGPRRRNRTRGPRRRARAARCHRWRTRRRSRRRPLGRSTSTAGWGARRTRQGDGVGGQRFVVVGSQCERGHHRDDGGPAAGGVRHAAQQVRVVQQPTQGLHSSSVVCGRGHCRSPGENRYPGTGRWRSPGPDRPRGRHRGPFCKLLAGWRA